MILTESREDYLKAVYVLGKMSPGPVKSIRIAEYMNVTRASTSVALKRLEKAGFVSRDADQDVLLTPEGEELAKRIYERHVFLAEFFKAIGVCPETAHQDACHLEHGVSDETFQQLKLFVNRTLYNKTPEA